ncbi:MAG: hypothetical protein JWP91_875 [Fibrobacteres bacterium]|nr:hypothetical protein [Fibrobacterota bacterium]
MNSPNHSHGKSLLLLSGLLYLAGCAALFPPNYRPYSDQVGFSDVQVARNTWEVSYVGPADFTEIQAKKMALLRAAELTRIAGARWFRIVSEDTHSRKTRLTSREVTSKPVKDTAFAREDAPKVVHETTTSQDAWIPMVTLVIAVEKAESAETLDAEVLVRDGKASGLLPKG